MSHARTDTLGRATFHHIAPRRDVRPTERELRWLKHIERHGPQSSTHLYELTRDTHDCRDTALRQLQKLRAGGFLSLPPQQRTTERAECRPYVYDLTKQARDLLTDLGMAEPSLRPTGHWWHGFLTASVTSAIDITATRLGFRYIPSHRFLPEDRITLALPHAQGILIPDQLFAIDYGGRFRAFALEVDRGTEPGVSTARRKSWARSIAQYRDILSTEAYKPHYGLKAQLVALWVFTSPAKQQRFLQLVKAHAGPAQALLLTQTIPADTGHPSTNELWTHLLEAPWVRASGDPVNLSDG